MASAATNTTEEFYQQYARFRGRLDGTAREEITFYNYHRGTYFGHLYTYLNRETSHTPLIPSTVMQFLGVNHERSVKNIIRAARWGLDILWEPAHTALETMIRCEHRREGEAGWSQEELETRLVALDAGQKELKKYLDSNIPHWLRWMDDLGVDKITQAHIPSEWELSFPLHHIAHLLVHVTNFGSDALKEEWHKLVQDAALSAEERAQNLSAATPQEQTCSKFQSVSATCGTLSSLIEKGYEISPEEIIDLLTQEIIHSFLPNLATPDQWGPTFLDLLKRGSLFLVGGLQAYRSQAKAPLLHTLLSETDKIPKEKPCGTFLLVPQEMQSSQALNRTHYIEAIQRSHPLASIAYNAAAHAGFYRIEDLGNGASIQTSFGERRAILIPTDVVWALPPKDLGQNASLTAPFFMGSMEEAHKLVSSLIEKGIQEFVKRILAAKIDQSTIQNDIVPNHLTPLIKIIRKYRDALLYTVLSGIKKERAGRFGILYPSHFHEEFTDIVLKNLIQKGMSIIRNGISSFRPGQFFQTLDRSAAVVLAAKQTFQAMSARFMQKQTTAKK